MGCSLTRLYSYWKPEQPPPATAMRSTVPSPCLLRMRPIRLAARSVKMTLFGARATSDIVYLSAAGAGSDE